MDLLINWICQGSALTILVWIAVGLSRSISAATRGDVWWLTHAIVLMMGMLTMGVLPIETFSGAGIPLQRAAASLPSVYPVLTLPETTGWLLTTLLLIWAVWVIVSMAKVLVALVHLLRLKTSVVAVSSDREARLSTWATLKHSGRRAQLATSTRLSTPAVLGLGSPMIVLPAWMIESLSDEVLDQVVAHEWAHVQRHDDLAMLAQALVRAVAGLHPAVWWIDRSISIEREVACDDWAASVTGSVKRYAGSLVILAGLRVSREPVTLAPAILAVRRAHLTRRIERLLDPRRNSSARRSPLALAFGGPALLAAGLVMSTLEPVRTASVVAAPIQAVRSFTLAPDLGFAPILAESVQTVRATARPPAHRVRSLDREILPITAGATPRSTEVANSLRLPAGPVQSAPEMLVGANPNGLDLIAASAPDAPALRLPFEEVPASSEPVRGTSPWTTVAARLSKTPALSVSAGATRLAHGVSRESKKVTASTGRFFSRLGRAVTTTPGRARDVPGPSNEPAVR